MLIHSLLIIFINRCKEHVNRVLVEDVSSEEDIHVMKNVKKVSTPGSYILQSEKRNTSKKRCFQSPRKSPNGKGQEISSKNLRESSKNLRESPKNLRESPKNLRESSKNLRESSKNLKGSPNKLNNSTISLRRTSKKQVSKDQRKFSMDLEEESFIDQAESTMDHMMPAKDHRVGEENDEMSSESQEVASKISMTSQKIPRPQFHFKKPGTSAFDGSKTAKCLSVAKKQAKVPKMYSMPSTSFNKPSRVKSGKSVLKSIFPDDDFSD